MLSVCSVCYLKVIFNCNNFCLLINPLFLSTKYVLLINGVLIADMTAHVKMELNAIHALAHAPALPDGRVSHVISPVTKVTMATNVNTSVLVRMVQLVNLLQEIAHVRRVIKEKGMDGL